MKLKRIHTVLPPLAALLTLQAQAAVEIGLLPLADPFPAVPPATSWSTLTFGTATDAAITTAAQFDAKIIAAADASTITTTLGSSGSYPPSANTIFRWNNGTGPTNPGGLTFLQSRATGNDYLLLLANCANTSGGDLSAIKISYDYSKLNNLGTETIKGLRAYWSTTGLPNSWTLINAFSVDTTAAPETPQALTANLILPAPLTNGSPFYVLWADQNSAGADPSYHIDNFAISAGINCTIEAGISNIVRLPGADPADPADDTVNFSLTVTGTGTLGAGWTVSGGPAAMLGTTGTYATAVPLSLPIAEFTSGTATISVRDDATVECADDVSFAPQAFTYAVTASASPVITFGPPAAGAGSYSPPLTTLEEPAWSGGTAGAATNSNVQNQPAPNAGVIKYFHATTSGVSLTTDKVDVNALKGSLLKGSLDIAFYSTSDTGLDAADAINARIEVALDGDFSNTAPGNIVATNIFDVPAGTATAFGDSIPAANPYINIGAALPTEDFTFHNFNTSVLIPSAAANPHARIIFQTITGISNSEHLLVDNIRFQANFDPTLTAAVAGTATWSNNGTVTAADDTFTVPVGVSGYNIGASTGWTSDEVPARNGLYATPNPVVFGPYTGRTPVAVQLSDALNSAVKSSVLSLNPPPATLTATLVAGSILRIENGPGDADDQVTFQVDITSANVGPEFTASVALVPSTVTGAGAYPAPGNPVTLTLNNVPAVAATVNVLIADASYPAAPAPVTVAVAIPAVAAPAPAVVGRKDFGAGLSDVAGGLIQAPEWVPFPGGRQLVMTAGLATDSVFESEDVNISGVGAVSFSAKLRARDNSAGSNFDVGDLFKAELVVDGGTSVIPLITSAMDTGSGASSTVAPGDAGGANGYLNGYTGTAGTDLITNTVYATAALEYNANKSRDEFNTAGQDANVAMEGLINLTATVPAGSSTVKLVVYGAGVTGSEAFIVEDVLFGLSSGGGDGDTDGDGVSDADEGIMGTNPNDGNDVLRLSQNPANSNQIQFPTKAGRYYRIYVSDDANEASHLQVWQDSGIATIAGDGNSASFNVDVLPGEARRFYRLHVMTTDGVGGNWPATIP